MTATNYPTINECPTLTNKQVRTTKINGKTYTAARLLKEFGNNPICEKYGLRKLGGALFLSECEFTVSIYCPHGARSIHLTK